MSGEGVSIGGVDAMDERILSLLVRNGRATWREIGAAVNLSANAVRQRVRRLESMGVVSGYVATLAPRGDAMASAIVLLTTDTTSDVAALERSIAAVAEVVEILDLAGVVDYEVRLRFTTPRQLHDAVNRIRVIPGVVGIETRLVLRQVLRRAEPEVSHSP